jgi:hypothetical protein
MRKLLPFVTAIALATRPDASAQPAGARLHSIALSVGRGGADERDESVSPLRYRGDGWGTALEYAFEPPRSRTTVGLSLVGTHLERVRTAEQPSDGDQTRIAFVVSHLRQVGAFSGGKWRLLAGPTLDATLAAREQYFADHASSDHLGAVLAIGPALLVERQPRPSRTFAYGVSVPLIAGVVQPHSNVHLLRAAGERRPVWASLGTARAVRQSVTYTSRSAEHWGVRAAVHVDLFRFDVDPGLAGTRTFASGSLVRWIR